MQEQEPEREYRPWMDTSLDVFDRLAVATRDEAMSITVFGYNSQGRPFRIQTMKFPITFDQFREQFGPGEYKIQVNAVGGGSLFVEENYVVGGVRGVGGVPQAFAGVMQDPQPILSAATDVKRLLDEQEKTFSKRLEAQEREHDERLRSRERELKAEALERRVESLTQQLQEQRLMPPAAVPSGDRFLQEKLISILEKQAAREANPDSGESDDGPGVIEQVKELAEAQKLLGGGDKASVGVALVESIGKLVGGMSEIGTVIVQSNLDLRKYALEAEERKSQREHNARMKELEVASKLRANGVIDAAGNVIAHDVGAVSDDISQADAAQVRGDGGMPNGDEMSDDEVLSDALGVFVRAALDAARRDVSEPDAIVADALGAVVDECGDDVIEGEPLPRVVLGELSKWAALDYAKKDSETQLRDFLLDVCGSVRAKITIQVGFKNAKVRKGVIALMSAIESVHKGLVGGDKTVVAWYEGVVSGEVPEDVGGGVKLQKRAGAEKSKVVSRESEVDNA